MTTHQEIRTIEHKGVKVSFKIDYDEGTASLVEKNGPDSWRPKKWLFAGRGLEYMNGWLCILEAMQMAVKECNKSLEADAFEKQKLKEQENIRLAGRVAGLG